MRRRINYFASMEDIEQDNAELIVDTISDPVVQLVDKTYPNKIDDQITEGDLISTDIERATEDVKLLEEVKDISTRLLLNKHEYISEEEGEDQLNSLSPLPLIIVLSLFCKLSLHHPE